MPSHARCVSHALLFIAQAERARARFLLRLLQLFTGTSSSSSSNPIRLITLKSIILLFYKNILDAPHTRLLVTRFLFSPSFRRLRRHLSTFSAFDRNFVLLFAECIEPNSGACSPWCADPCTALGTTLVLPRVVRQTRPAGELNQTLQF